MFFVLREGSTQEEQWSWDEIGEMCRSGELSAGTMVFLPDDNAWARITDTEHGEIFAAAAGAVTDTSAAEAHLAQQEYKEARERLDREGSSVDMLIEVGRLAAEAGDREASRRHFQEALDLQPFSGRARQEIMRRFSRAECRQFRHLDRPAPVWDDLSELWSFPFASGPLYAGVIGAVVAAVSFVPFGGWIVGLLMFLWGYQVMRHVADDGTQPPLWHRALGDPVRELVLPLLAACSVFLEYGAIFYGIARGTMFIEHESGNVLSFVGTSPVLLVTIPVVMIAILPAVAAIIAHRGNPFSALLPWNVVRAAILMEGDYAITLLFLLVVGFLVGLVDFALGGIPVAGKIIHASALTVAVAMSGLLLGRLLGRNGHILERRRA